MAAQDEEAGGTADEKLVREARRRLKLCQTWESEARLRHIADVKFCEGDSDNKWQWDQGALTARGNKPALTVSKVRQHCLQIINEARENKAQIEIRPVGDGATYEAAKVYEGVVRHIENQSNASEAYESAFWRQVTGGWGYWRVVTDYEDPRSFDQEIYIRRVPDPLKVFLDPDIHEFDGSDANYGFVFRDVARDDAEREYPWLKDEPTSTASETIGNLSLDEDWSDKDHVREAEYFRRSEIADRLLLLQGPAGDTTTMLASELKGEELPFGVQIVSERPTFRTQVEWFKVVRDRIVDRKPWPGRYIPLVRCIGEETVIDNKLDRKGHVRALKDPQRMYNWWSSAAVEYSASQTKSPWLLSKRAIEGVERYWADANDVNRAYLLWNDVSNDTGASEIAKPERVMPATALPAAMEGMRITQNELMMASGQYQSQFGENENAKSGVAINARQRQGDKATYHYIDHQAQSLRHTGRILLDLIPRIYDTERVIKIMAEDGSQSEVNIKPGLGQPYQQMVNGQPASAQEVKAAQGDDNLRDRVQTIFDPSVGRYDVVADVGPAYATRRQEAFNALSQIIGQNQHLVGVAGDLMFRAADFPMADEIAERLKRTVPANVLGEAPPPELQQAQAQSQQLQQAVAALQKKLEEAEAKLADKDDDHEVKSYDAETRRLSAVNQIDPMALLPVVRNLVSQIMGERVEPHIIDATAMDASMAPQPMPAEAAPPPQ